MQLDLSKNINVALVDPDTLIGHFRTHLIYDQILSPRLDKALKKWEQSNWAAPAQRQKLAYIILVELFSYRFTFPLRRIETRCLLSKDFKFTRFIEVARTLKAKYEAETSATTLATFSATPRPSRRYINNMKGSSHTRGRGRSRSRPSQFCSACSSRSRCCRIFSGFRCQLQG